MDAHAHGDGILRDGGVVFECALLAALRLPLVAMTAVEAVQMPHRCASGTVAGAAAGEEAGCAGCDIAVVVGIGLLAWAGVLEAVVAVVVGEESSARSRRTCA